MFKNTNKTVLFVSLLLASIGIGCSGESGSEDPGADLQRRPSVSGERADCIGDREEVNAVWDRCPSTYDEAVAGIAQCNGCTAKEAGLSGQVPALSIGWGTHAKNCFYDPQTKELVGAVACDDIPVYCGQTSYSIRFGTAPAECRVIEKPEVELSH